MDAKRLLTILLASGAVWVLVIVVHLADQEDSKEKPELKDFKHIPYELPHHDQQKTNINYNLNPRPVNPKVKVDHIFKIPGQIMKGKISCGGHAMDRCEECGNNEYNCNGQCQWNSDRRVCQDPMKLADDSDKVLTSTTTPKPEFLRPTPTHVARNGVFVSKAEIRKVVNGKDSDLDKTMRRYHGWLAVDDEGEPLYTPVPLSKPIKDWTKEEVEKAHHGYQFNTNVTASIPMDREYGKLFADPKCYSKVSDFHDSGIIMEASIIIVFHNEAWTTLLRTVHGLLNKTPPHYLKEIVLIDDGSHLDEKPWLGEELMNYIAKLPKIVYKRTEERKGLMAARMLGADVAVSDNLIFLDSHVEPADGYIEPLLEFLHEDYKHVAVPTIDTIQATDFKEKPGGITILAHGWTLGQVAVFRKESKYENMDSPIMAGGLFAITKKYFDELGRYDKELKQWGGEESELSFKIHMCGGRLVCAPCSHIGHVFRDTDDSKKGAYVVDYNLVTRNKLRVAQSWMGEYAGIAKLGLGNLPKNYTLGDLSDTFDLQKKLECKDFGWYMKNVYPELLAPQLDGARAGALVSLGKKDWCLDIMGAKNEGNPMGIFPCHWTHGTQAWIFSGDGNIMAFGVLDGTICASIAKKKADREKDPLRATKCSEETKWNYNQVTKQMVHVKMNECLVFKDPAHKLDVEPCNDKSKWQKFYWYGPTEEDFRKGIVDDPPRKLL